jgi:UDP-3-O-[3-hydroxymyristoyl] glucosamine N-acyltransferase
MAFGPFDVSFRISTPLRRANMSRTAGELATYLDAAIEGDSHMLISGVASPERATAQDVIYLDSPRNQDRAQKSAALCVFAKPGALLEGKTILTTAQPKFAFAKAAAWLLSKVPAKTGIHPTAIVGADCKLGANVTLGPYVVVEDCVEIGDRTVIEAFCFVGSGACLGQDCWLHPRVTLYAGARLGNRVEAHAGAVIGGDGFGYVFGEGRHWKFPQIGGVEIGEDVEIGCNTTIDRGSLANTRVSDGVKIDNLVQVAHNVQIGEHSVIAAQTGISGSTLVGKHVQVGGQAGIGDHCIVEDDAMVGGQAGVVVGKTVRRGQIVWGTPARPLQKFKQQYAWVARLPELAERVRTLESKLTAESD